MRDYFHACKSVVSARLCDTVKALSEAPMKRRNFLSGLLAAPLALKARLAQFFGRKPVDLCNASIGDLVLRVQPGVRPPQGQALLDLRDMWAASTPTPFNHYSFVTGLDYPINDPSSAHCFLPRGHIGPHVLLNPR